ncbi:MAG: arsenic resistance protein, partial [Hyphomicrobiales bacterium]
MTLTTTASPLGLFERYLTVWVAASIALGIGLDATFPGIFQAIARLEYAGVNLAVALFIWVMIYPMMVNVDFSSI